MKGPFQLNKGNYSLHHLQKDLLSGLIVGVIAIPLAMAFAIASGVKPEYGIYTTIIAGIIISVFGGSKFQIGGPTGAFVPILLGIVIAYGYEDLLLAGLLAGIILVIMGIFKIGSLIKFIPRPVTIGFTSGIAIIIFTGQIANFFGLEGITKHESFIANMREIVIHFHTVNIYSIIISIICFFFILATPKVLPKVPSPIIGLLFSTLIGYFFFTDQIATIGSAYGGIPNSLPAFHLPELSLERIQRLIVPAFAIAVLGGIESLLSAVVADTITGTKHNSNKELIGQGIANIVAPLFGGIPATGAIARTATNIKSGAASRMSGVFHGLIVLVTLLLFAPLASQIPLASMAPVLMMVAWNMSERRAFSRVLKLKNGESLVLLTTFFFTVFTSITTAVLVGLALSILLFIQKMTNVQIVTKVLPEHDCSQIEMLAINGPLFFGNAELFEQRVIETIQPEAAVLILRMKSVPFIDITAEENLLNVIKSIQKNNGILLVAEASPKLIKGLKRGSIYEKIGSNHFFAHIDDAIEYALQMIDH
ncbi:SulP family inorganic anion transporter [Psychrobacillus sp. OK032]|uniref:SulP family inorganic anion transporter n=1 Tax=Psychrobacillus sp. OK032 TaxID=1884358 RepID=UPI0008B77AEE|nr:sulfate permease [Psychrobacillus sp. OK032]SES40349.1 sulfate permease, SulP family [Psychrobacillus sp. OK032]